MLRVTESRTGAFAWVAYFAALPLVIASYVLLAGGPRAAPLG